MQQIPRRRLLAPPALLLLFLIAVATAVSLCPPAVAQAIVREHGPVESLTVAGYLAIAVWLLAARGEAGDAPAFARTAAFAVALLAARELDLDKAFTTDGVLETRFYLGTQASLAEKAVAALVVVVCLSIPLRLRCHVPAWLMDLRARRAAYAHTLAVALAMLPTTKLLDATPRLLRDDLGLLLPAEIKARVGIVEEVLELGIPLLLALALLQYRWDRVAAAIATGRAGARGAAPGRYIGGTRPSRPTTTTAASRAPSGWRSATGTKTWLPGRSSPSSPDASLTTGVSGGTTRVWSPPG